MITVDKSVRSTLVQTVRISWLHIWKKQLAASKSPGEKHYFDQFLFYFIEGGSLGVLPLGDVGRKDHSLPLLHAHSGMN